MKRLFYISLALVLLTTVGCRRRYSAERQYERYLKDSNRVEFVAPREDTVEVEVEELASDKDPVETEGLFSIPDIPEERGVNMSSSDDELREIMEGKDLEKEAAKGKKKAEE
jgi:hypothetical protein